MACVLIFHFPNAKWISALIGILITCFKAAAQENRTPSGDLVKIMAGRNAWLHNVCSQADKDDGNPFGEALIQRADLLA
ncbi:MAG: hypothetical protein CTY16_05745 [Methylobacter sp.]|nr:MAG: hypothetical protein CTY16_05745 [Methylobacter sp.]